MRTKGRTATRPNPRKPKVLIAAGGGHITEIEMIIGLHRRGVNIHAALESHSGHLARLGDAGVPTRTLDLRGTVDLSNVRLIRRWIGNEGFNILHGLANWQVANFLTASYGMPNRVVAYRGAIGHVSRWDPSCYLKWLSPRLDKIVCVSRAVERDLSKSGVSPEKLITIYKGHNLQWYRELDGPGTRAKVNQMFTIPSDAVLVGMAANMRPVKGADVLLQAMHQLPDHVHALLIGEVRDESLYRLAQHPALRNRVHFTGFRKDAPALIGALDINVAPSRGREGLTKTILEGMAQSVPAVVSEAGGLPETVDHDHSGFVFPIDDTAQLAAHLEALASSRQLRRTMGRHGKAIAGDRFHINRTVEATAALYADLAGSPL